MFLQIGWEYKGFRLDHLKLCNSHGTGTDCDCDMVETKSYNIILTH